jgi:hypothetical protein
MPVPVPLEPRDDYLGAILVGIAFGCATLWDFYWVTVRPMDFVAVVLLVAAVIVSQGSIGEFRRPLDLAVGVPLSLLGGIILVYGIIGIFVDVQNAKPVTGIVLSVLAMFAIVAGVPPNDRVLSVTVRTLIVIHCGALLLQAAVYYVSGQVLNFHFFLGLEPRLLSSIFRPAGLFLEPAVFSLAMILMLGIRVRLREPFDWYEGLALICVLISLSLWGIGAVVIYLLLFRRALLMVITSTAAVVALLWIEQADLLVGKIVRFFFSRVANLSTDGSAQGRYGGIDIFFDDPARHWVVWFGRGINNDYEQLGSAGFTFLLNSFGIIGSLALAVCIVFLSRRIRISLLLLIGLILTAAPIFTNVAWLSAIALMMQRSGRSVGSPTSVNS